MTAVRPTSTSGYGLSPEAPAETATPEERMWRAVIDCAFRDAINPPLALLSSGSDLSMQRDRLIAQARHWLLEDRRDFVVVCDLAGRDPHEVRDQARWLLSNPELSDAYASASRTGGTRRQYSKVRAAS